MSTPTPPPSSESQAINEIVSSSKRVLLLLDIQEAMLQPPPIGVPGSSTVLTNLAEIIAQARRASPPPLIVHVRNIGDSGDTDEPNTPGWQLIFPPEPTELVVDKLKNNAFTGTLLNDIIPHDAEIVVAGFQTDFSIRATCSAALGRGNEVLLIRGHMRRMIGLRCFMGVVLRLLILLRWRLKQSWRRLGCICLR
ncbi:Isochorismatase-like protein [Cyathus striatus]|nr:Isochorismatase-like protein [Cyathus striatus]